jgi:soluble lytic murein transglycosylase-like protein
MERTPYQGSSDPRNSYRFRLRVPLATLATILFLALTFEPTRSDTAPADPNLRPRLDAATQTQDLERFLVAGSSAASHGFHAFRSRDLDAAASPVLEASSLPHRFSMLDAGPNVEEKRRFLHQMPYGAAIALAAERNHVDGLLLAAMVSVESGFSPHALSPQGARGLMQVIPDVASDFGIKGDLFDPHVNLEVGSRFVAGLIKDYKGDLDLALAAYNAGPGVVDRYKGIPPYQETQGYVRQVLAQYAEYHRKAGSPTVLAKAVAKAPVRTSSTEGFRMERVRTDSFHGFPTERSR